MRKKGALDLTEGNITRLIIVFVLPIIAGSVIQQLYATVDAVIVGRFVGKAGLAAIDSVATLFKFPINFLSGLSSGATVVISSYLGQKKVQELDRSIHSAYTLAVVIGLASSLVGVLASPWLLRAMSVPEDIYFMTLTYTRIYFAGLWAMTLYNMVAGILRAFGDSRSPFYILIVCCVMNILGDLIFVGFFHGGVGAAAAATMVSQLVSGILAIWRLESAKNHCQGHVWSLMFHRSHMGHILQKGVPLGIQATLFPIANTIVHASINTMGTDVIAAWAVCEKLDLVIWLIADAMSPALGTYVAQNMGAGKIRRVKAGAYTGAVISFLVVAFISGLLYFFPGPLGGLFVTRSDGQVILPLVIRYMRMMAPFYVFYSLAESFSGSCYGMGDTVRPMIVTLLCTCLLRVLGIWFVLPAFHSMECIVYLYIASWIATGSSLLAMFIYKSRNLNAQGL